MNARWRVALCASLGLLLASTAWSADTATRESARKSGLEQDAQCTACHNEGWRVPSVLRSMSVPVTMDPRQNVTFVGLRYMYRWQ